MPLFLLDIHRRIKNDTKVARLPVDFEFVSARVKRASLISTESYRFRFVGLRILPEDGLEHQPNFLEHHPYKQDVGGSSPSLPTNLQSFSG